MPLMYLPTKNHRVSDTPFNVIRDYLPLAFDEVKSSESGWSHSLGGVRLEDRAATTSLCYPKQEIGVSKVEAM